MKTPFDFDYDLWVSEDGKAMVGVKRTGETCEVSQETMRLFRGEEKGTEGIRREFLWLAAAEM